MVLVLALGDLHVPHRVTDLPPAFKQLLAPGKIEHILCTGDLCSGDMLDYLRSVCSDVHVVRGVFDACLGNNFPETKVVTIGQFRIGLIHGHQAVPWGDAEALAAVQRQLAVDILVSGNTHSFKAEKYEDRLFINPGSATGAPCPPAVAGRPSFCILDLEGSRVECYHYALEGDEVKVIKLEFFKAAPSP